jgi:hypothetical protein
MELTDESVVKAHIILGGFFFNDTFGAVNNELALEVRHTQADGTMSEWKRVTDYFPADITGEVFLLDFNFTGFDSKAAYDFQSRVVDKLLTVETPIYTATLSPVFDWSEKDFNVNVATTLKGGLSVENGLSVTGEVKLNEAQLLMPYILSDTATNGDIEFELSNSLDKYQYIEIFYETVGGAVGGYTKLHGEFTKTAKDMYLSLIASTSANNTYIYKTRYTISIYGIYPKAAKSGSLIVVNDSIDTYDEGENMINITRVVGWR